MWCAYSLSETATNLYLLLLITIPFPYRKRIVLSGLPGGTTFWSPCRIQTSSGLGKICIYSVSNLAGEHKDFLVVLLGKSVGFQSRKLFAFLCEVFISWEQLYYFFLWKECIISVQKESSFHCFTLSSPFWRSFESLLLCSVLVVTVWLWLPSERYICVMHVLYSTAAYSKKVFFYK